MAEMILFLKNVIAVAEISNNFLKKVVAMAEILKERFQSRSGLCSSLSGILSNLGPNVSSYGCFCTFGAPMFRDFDWSIRMLMYFDFHSEISVTTIKLRRDKVESRQPLCSAGLPRNRF
jgi:hypothetical protein